ncbi:MAG TPA: hypothetical protein VIM00_07690 [Candidatus Acidoferrum sp.]
MRAIAGVAVKVEAAAAGVVINVEKELRKLGEVVNVPQMTRVAGPEEFKI